MDQTTPSLVFHFSPCKQGEKLWYTMSMKIKARDILGVYWHAARRYKLLLFCIIAAIIVSNLLFLIIPFYYRDFFDTLTGTPSDGRVRTLVMLLVAVLVTRVLSEISIDIAKFCNNYFQPLVMRDLKDNALAYLLDHSYGFFSNQFGGALVQRLRRLTRAFENFADRLYWDLVPLILKMVVIFVILWQMYPTIAVIIGVWALIFILFNYAYSRWKLKYDTARAAQDSQVTATAADAITNHTTIQLFTGTAHELSLFRKVTETLRRLMTFTWSLRTVLDVVQAFLSIAVEFALFYYALKLWRVGAITIGGFVFIESYLFQLMDRLWDFGRVVRDFYESFADANEMVTVLKTPHEVRDAPTAKPMVVTDGQIEFRAVRFSYHQTRSVLGGVDLIIKPREKVALIGPSGAGKSTVVKLLFRLYDTDGGKILIDGQNIARATQESLRAQLSPVPQDPILFHRTLMENIRYGRRTATDEEVMAAARMAHCHEFIEELPKKYETFVGERGIKLSGGERQRVAIARAILKNAPILVLDEATSSLDSESEMLIQDALVNLMKDKTTIVIAHRLSTIRKMDRIVVIDDGRVVEEGTHDTLVRRQKSLYYKLWKLQAGGFLVNTEI